MNSVNRKQCQRIWEERVRYSYVKKHVIVMIVADWAYFNSFKNLALISFFVNVEKF